MKRISGPPVAVSVPSVANSGFSKGTLHDLDGEILEIELDEALDCPLGARAFLHLGAGSPSRAVGEVTRVEGRLLAVRLTSGWVPINQREYPRHKVCVPVLLEQFPEGARAIGVLLDVSLGGAAIEASEWVHDDLTFKMPGKSGEWLCEVVSRRPSEAGALLHCRFSDPEVDVSVFLPEAA